MGPRPADFDEELVRQSPTYAKWTGLVDGQKLRYACREFVKGQGDDEERLLRRIMIARRNNIRDHEMLKRARSRHTPTTTTNMSTAMSTTTTMSTTAGPVVVPVGLADAVQAAVDEAAAAAAKPAAAVPMRTRRPPHSFSDHQVEKEMDVASVEKTRSYRTWVELAHGSEFVVRTWHSIRITKCVCCVFVCVCVFKYGQPAAARSDGAVLRSAVEESPQAAIHLLRLVFFFVRTASHCIIALRSTIKSTLKAAKGTIGCCARTFGVACATAAKTSKWWNA